MTVQRRDYVVVGAGSGGCAAAHRLSEDPDATVLVLDAGGPDVRPEIANAMEWPLLLGSEVDWSYVTSPQDGTAGREHPVARSEALRIPFGGGALLRDPGGT